MNFALMVNLFGAELRNNPNGKIGHYCLQNENSQL